MFRLDKEQIFREESKKLLNTKDQSTRPAPFFERNYCRQKEE